MDSSKRSAADFSSYLISDRMGQSSVPNGVLNRDVPDRPLRVPETKESVFFWKNVRVGSILAFKSRMVVGGKDQVRATADKNNCVHIRIRGSKAFAGHGDDID